jgi:phosphopantothenoylcysteine decarboxylase/phosphopantothenate--cysteine ligase
MVVQIFLQKEKIMISPLEGKNIILGVTGSIACYKAANIASRLSQEGASVDVILTKGASEFITPLTFKSLTHRAVVTDMYDQQSELAVEHVALARRADVILVAPATANFLAKIAHGLADDALSATILAATADLVVAPAMDGNMYYNQATQSNMELLSDRGVKIVGPESGHLASGLSAIGRMSDIDKIIDSLYVVIGRKGDLVGKTLVVSAGGTQEPIDPVRVITNRSSGKMGYAIAKAARDRGATVILVTAANSLPDPGGVEIKRVTTVSDMREAVLSSCGSADALVMAAAVSDYRPARIENQKIKKDSEDKGLTLELVKNNDFFLEVPEGVLRIGFAAESENLLANAKDKLKQKGMVLIAANDITAEDSGFNVDTNRVTLLDTNGNVDELPLLSKYEVGHRILDRVASFLI